MRRDARRGGLCDLLLCVVGWGVAASLRRAYSAQLAPATPAQTPLLPTPARCLSSSVENPFLPQVKFKAARKERIVTQLE